MNHFRLSRSACILAVPVLAGTAAPAVPDDKPPPAKPTIEFRDFPGKPEDGASYKFSLFVEVEGSKQRFESKDNAATGGFTAAALAGFLRRSVEQAPGWNCSVDGAKLVIEGWTDPKTGKFHPVKTIRFESPNLPMERFPRVTYPGDKKG